MSLRQLQLVHNTYNATGQTRMSTLKVTIGRKDVHVGNELTDGRKIAEIDGETVLLSDLSLITLDDAVQAIIPDLTGKTILTPAAALTIADGPDNTGRVLYTDGSEGYLFHAMFPGQGTQRARNELLKLDRKLKSKAPASAAA